MADESELLRRTIALERRFLRPDRSPLDESILAGATGPEIWGRAIAAGRLPSSWADDPRRRFRASAAQLRRGPELTTESRASFDADGRCLTAVPIDRQAARLLASDPQGMLAAEQHVRELIAALVVFGIDARAPRIAWRLAGAAVERPEAGEPPLGQLRAPIQRVRELMQRLTGRLLEPPHPHVRFRLTHELLTWAHRRARALDLRIPDEFGPIAGRRLGELDDPFDPWLKLIATGYWPWLVSESTIELAAPFPTPSGSRPDKRGRPDMASVARSRPSSLWSERLSMLRLACMRGDRAWAERMWIRVPDTRDSSSAPLIHFAVYGGPELLDLLVAHDPKVDVDEPDDEGRTALMLAAGLPRQGPRGAQPREVDVPIGAVLGPASCAWLVARGARLEAQDLRGWTALHWAAHEGRVAGVAALVRQRAELDARDGFGRTPLLVALGDDVRELPLMTLREVIEALLSAGADADARDELGSTALHYLAASVHTERRSLARLLLQAGARPSRDRVGRAPADLAISPIAHEPAFDPRTPVAAGPGAWPARKRAVELERALTDDLHADGRAPLDTLAVWADWLQSQGDARGELLAAELEAGAVGRKRRRTRTVALERLSLALQAARDRGLRLADPGSMLGTPWIEVRRKHGMIVRARVDPSMLAISFVAALPALAALLDHEPLLTDLRLTCGALHHWPYLLATLTELDPVMQVRRLVLTDLPAEVPRLDMLAPVFPRVRELRLIGRGKLDSLTLDWPALEVLRIRHGDTSEWGRGGTAFELVAGQLHTLDLGLPIAGRARDEELAGFRALVEQLGPNLATLRLLPVAAEFLAALVDASPLPGLTTLVLERVRGQAIEQLADQLARTSASWFDRLERLELSVSATVFEQRGDVLELLRARLPKLEVSIR